MFLHQCIDDKIYNQFIEFSSVNVSIYIHVCVYLS